MRVIKTGSIAIICAVALSLGLAGCSKIPGTDAHRIEAAKEFIKLSLNDAESAKFKDLTVVSNGDTKAVCGFLNAKNQMGGYTGFTRIMADPDKKQVSFEQQIPDGETKEETAGRCEKTKKFAADSPELPALQDTVSMVCKQTDERIAAIEGMEEFEAGWAELCAKAMPKA